MRLISKWITILTYSEISPEASREPCLWAVVPAAGSGSRMHSDLPKQYMLLNGIPIIEHTVNALLSHHRIKSLMLCLPVSDQRFSRLAIADDKRIQTTQGGDSRAQSVLNGLNALDAHDDDWVLVHDAARPCLSPRLLARLIKQVDNDGIGGILATPVKDTLKHANQQRRVCSTIDRSELWQAQTPQMFRYGLLKKALTYAIDTGEPVTDEASALELMGYQPRLIEGEARNLKVTTRDDVEIAEFLLRA